MLSRLRDSRALRDICGFGDDVPSESALSRFVSRLADHQELVELDLVDITSELRDLVPATKKHPGRQPQPLPPLGSVLAVDGSVFLTSSCR